ncbi:RDD family protein [Dyadobacter psychrotolerans]|uniref:RDD family protein n=1 Tax=Dyadobacter psychrotolerans TaxID=2541721 RepID=A0A4R5DFK6_9BACT|nr:RDD family protein [Dyadobacter psychrotolerans]TDE11957.1 RDD family protein [Dyadobacter psychrotolerans]
MSLQIETAQNVGVDYEIASIGERILAQIVDYAVYFGWILTVFGIKILFDPNNRLFSETWMLTAGIFLPIVLCPLLCEYYLDGQTVGKMALKIKVIQLDGNKATLSSYLLRWLLAAVDISTFSGMIAILTIAINGKGQRLGDIAAGTAVIKTQPTVKLEHILTPDFDTTYQPKYRGAAQLSDKDIRTIKKVLASGNDELIEKTMHKVEVLLGVNSLDTGNVFLRTVVNDYNFYANADL